MVRFETVIKKFNDQGEKTGWTYIEVPAAIATKLVPGNKKGFRVKGKLDAVPFQQLSLLPMGQGNFILTLNASVRKALGKRHGDSLKVQMEVDIEEIKPPKELMEVFEEEPELFQKFQAFTKGTQNYYFKWIDTAKTDPTRAKRIAAVIRSLELNQDFGGMLRSLRDQKIQ